jgi:hypothetical protein
LESFASSEALQDLTILRGEAYSLVSTTVGWQSLRTALDISDEKMMNQLSDRAAVSKLIIALERELVTLSRMQGVKLTAFLKDSFANQEGSEKDMMNNDYYTSAIEEGNANNGNTDSSELGNANSNAANLSDNTKITNFVNEWLTVISDSVVAVFLSAVLKLSKISNLGSLQILTDIDYLRYVARH